MTDSITDKNNTHFERGFARFLMRDLNDFVKDPQKTASLKEMVLKGIEEDYKTNFNETIEDRIERTKKLFLFYDSNLKEIMDRLKIGPSIEDESIDEAYSNHTIYKSSVLALITKAKAYYNNSDKEEDKKYNQYLLDVFKDIADPEFRQFFNQLIEMGRQSRK